MITTDRLSLVPQTTELLSAEINDHVQLAHLLSASVPANWPPESTRDALAFFHESVKSSPNQIGWFGWYAVVSHTNDGMPAELVGCGGFMGPPEGGVVQIGYSVIDQHQGNGYATEIVSALVNWAFSHSDCTLATAETEWANPQSARVLEKNGFDRVESPSTTGGSRFELTKTAQDESPSA
jgi:ribosomal-protein-alanine N-acetyltransferase